MLYSCFTGSFHMLYCCKGYKNVTKHNKFFQSRFFVCFSDLESFILKHKKVFKPKVPFPKILYILSGWVLFIFQARKVTSRNINNFFRVSVSWNIRTTFLILELESSISRNIRNISTFFNFSSLGWKML